MAKTSGTVQWMEVAPPRLVCRFRRPLDKKLDTIAEEVHDGDLMEGFQTAFVKACSLQAEPNVQRHAAGFQLSRF